MRHISIKSRLIAVLVVFIIAFMGFGFFAIMKVGELEHVTNSIYEDPLKISSAVMEARIDIAKLQEQVRDTLVVGNEENVKEALLEVSFLERRIYDSLDLIRTYVASEDSLELEKSVRESFIKWRKNQDQILKESLQGNKQIAIEINKGPNIILAESIEQNLIRIDNNAKYRAFQLVKQANDIQIEMERLLIIINIALSIFFIILFSLVTRSIVRSINILQHTMNESAVTGVLRDAVLEGNNEIAGIAKYYNVLIQKLRNQFWLKDGQNSLNQEISASADLKDMTQRCLGFIVKTLGIGKGALYIYNYDSKQLELHTSYAYTEKERSFGSYALGEGIIGQAGLEKRPIYLENIRAYEGYISTGVMLEAPINIYTFPLIFEGNMHGVIELASFEPFDDMKREFLKQAGEIIAANVYSEIQNHKVKKLLDISQKSQMEASYNSSQLLKTNQMLEEQQLRLQQQSEELQQTNMQLEEHQLLMEEQTKLLNIRNKQLESSRMELLKHSKELESANKYKSQFLANMSHELRTPLNSIILLSRLLMKNEKRDLSKNHLEKLDVIYNSGQELLRLINDILDLSKIEAGKMNIDNQEFNTKDFLKEVKKMFEGVAQEKDIKLVCKDFVNSKLNGDYNKISQIIRNLLSNAIKFTDKGTVSLEIKPSENNDIHMIITDTGIGVSKDNLNRIFEEFHQGDGSISRNFGGTGLGLSISKKLAEVMNGEIHVQSEEGKGSSFTLILRDAAVPPNKHQDMLGIRMDSIEGLALKEVAITMETDRTILIIEDDEIFAEYIKKINASMGYNSIIAATGREGLRQAINNSIDAILLDLNLPDITGMEVLKELKDIQKLRSIPVHVLSSKNKNNAPQKMGAVGYKEKPLEEKEIAEIIAKMINIKEKEPKHLLIVEDNEMQRNVIKELLEGIGIAIDTADTGEAAIVKIQDCSYDAIILDLELKSGEGIDVCKFMQMKQIETPLIIYTGRALTEEQESEIGKYTDSIIIKTAASDDRLLDEVTLFLHKLNKKERKSHYLISKTNKQHALTLKGRKILIVDDDPRNIFVLASALEDFGGEIVEAENGDSALKLLEQQKVDLVLIDIMMPVMDGYKVIKKIRGSKVYGSIPIIAVTAKSLKDDREKCIAAGANDYISKPVDYDTLVRLVKAWISK
ncbi:MAG TPA: response regulator [Patescibacteria group bacterium]|nr:response regulator [Patescibacteria group bacterium]